ncbi:MAG: hypothetical protein AAF609_09125 [Cyanobacteria bacterium P01_C01_bin.120]
MLEVTVRSMMQDAAQKLTGLNKQAFMAKVADDCFNDSAHQAKTPLGWNRHNVQLGLHERRPGVVCLAHD